MVDTPLTDAIAGAYEVLTKFNPYHNAENGQFDFAPGGGSATPVETVRERNRRLQLEELNRVALTERPTHYSAQHTTAEQRLHAEDWVETRQSLPTITERDYGIADVAFYNPREGVFYLGTQEHLAHGDFAFAAGYRKEGIDETWTATIDRMVRDDWVRIALEYNQSTDKLSAVSIQSYNARALKDAASRLPPNTTVYWDLYSYATDAPRAAGTMKAGDVAAPPPASMVNDPGARSTLWWQKVEDEEARAHPEHEPIRVSYYKFNPNHDELGRFTFADEGVVPSTNDTPTALEQANPNLPDFAVTALRKIRDESGGDPAHVDGNGVVRAADGRILGQVEQDGTVLSTFPLREHTWNEAPDPLKEPGMAENVRSACVALAQERGPNDIERGIVIDKDGNVATDIEGRAPTEEEKQAGISGTVEYTSEQLPEESVSIHSHPTNWGQSTQDVMTSAMRNCTASIVVTANDEMWIIRPRYVDAQGRPDWHNEHLFAVDGPTAEAYAEQNAGEYARRIERAGTYIPPQDEAHIPPDDKPNIRFKEEFLRILSSRGYLTFEKVKVPKNAPKTLLPGSRAVAAAAPRTVVTVHEWNYGADPVVVRRDNERLTRELMALRDRTPAQKFNPYHNELGQFDFAPGGGDASSFDRAQPAPTGANQSVADAIERLPDDAVLRFYHGTTVKGAEGIIRDRRINPDDLGSVGLASDRATARSYAIIRAMREGGPSTVRDRTAVIEVAVRRSELGHTMDSPALRPGAGERTRYLMGEIGGSGENAILVSAANKERDFHVRLLAARVIDRDTGKPLTKYNPNHDPETGRFTTGDGGGVDVGQPELKGNKAWNAFVKRGSYGLGQVLTEDDLKIRSMAPANTEERLALQHYIRSGFAEINDRLRGNYTEVRRLSDEQFDATVRTLDGYFAHSVIDTPVVAVRALPIHFTKDMEPGKVYTDKGYVSTSIADTPPGMAFQAMAVIHIPEGAHAIIGSGSEQELILPRNSRFYVEKNMRDGRDVELRLLLD